MVSEISNIEWETQAREAEEKAIKLDRRAQSFPIEGELFLEAAKIARKSARYYEFARQSTIDEFQKLVFLANYFINIGNSHKSLGNFFYYSEQPMRAAKFYERAIEQYALADSQMPTTLKDYSNIVQDSVAHQTRLLGLIADCKGKDAKMRNDWTQALNHFMRAKEHWMKLEAIAGDYAHSVNTKAMIQSAEREIHVCRLVISLEQKNLAGALEQAELALAAAAKAFQEDPSWFEYKKALMAAISLRESLSAFSSLLKRADVADKTMLAFQQLQDKTDAYLDNLASYKFEREVESYLRGEHQYTHSRCNYKPPYLGKDIDVYASKGERVVTITICECRLRFNDRPIEVTEIEKFSKLVSVVRDYERKRATKEGKRVKLHAWFVTNADSIENKAASMAKRNKIDIKHAEVPKGRERLLRDTSWQVSKIRGIKRTVT